GAHRGMQHAHLLELWRREYAETPLLEELGDHEHRREGRAEVVGELDLRRGRHVTCWPRLASPAVAGGATGESNPCVGVRWSPCRSSNRYNVVRSTPARRAAPDMLPFVRPTSVVR